MPSQENKISAISEATDEADLLLQVRRGRALHAPLLARAALQRAIELDCLPAYSAALVRLYRKMDEDARNPFVFDSVIRALVVSGRRISAIEFARESNSKEAAAWLDNLSALLPEPSNASVRERGES